MFVNSAYSRQQIYLLKILINFATDVLYVADFLLRNPKIILHMMRELVLSVREVSIAFLGMFIQSTYDNQYKEYQDSPLTDNKVPLSNYLSELTGNTMKMYTRIQDFDSITSFDGRSFVYSGVKMDIAGGLAPDGSVLDYDSISEILANYFCSGEC